MKIGTTEAIYQRLYSHYGPQYWWPAESPFEVMVGAILTQNTAWTNVEKAMLRIKKNIHLGEHELLALDPHQLADWIKPSGYFNIKTKRLRALCEWLAKNGGVTELNQWPTNQLRTSLLAVYGVGPETADDIVLYAFNRPVFVIDAYTRRLFSRLGLINGDEAYETLRTLFEDSLPKRANLFNEYHALVVLHAKQVCKPKPDCEHCFFNDNCDLTTRH